MGIPDPDPTHEKCTKGADGKDLCYGIQKWPDGTFSIDSCCGGCSAAQDIKFCPYCGEALK